MYENRKKKVKMRVEYRVSLNFQKEILKQTQTILLYTNLYYNPPK